MRSLILISLLTLTGCSMTPTQSKWAGITVSVVATGLILAHQQDGGKPVVDSERKQTCYSGSPCLPPGGK